MLTGVDTLARIQVTATITRDGRKLVSYRDNRPGTCMSLSELVFKWKLIRDRLAENFPPFLRYQRGTNSATYVC